MNKPAKHILIQNYHPTASLALVRDFQRIGFKVYCPDSDWDRISYAGGCNADLGGELISQHDYFSLEPGFVLIPCKFQEDDLREIADEHGDELILNIAQHGQYYELGISEIMICPDIITFDMYPAAMRHKLLYFPRPNLGREFKKNVSYAFRRKAVRSFISIPHVWVHGYAAYHEFKARYPHDCRLHGFEAPDGYLKHLHCNAVMADAFFTAHFKDDESYGFSCVESMMLGTPICSLKKFMRDKTLGRFFLDESNAIVADTVDEVIERMQLLSFDQYSEMSTNARKRVLDLTSDQNTILRLKAALADEYPGLFADLPMGAISE